MSHPSIDNDLARHTHRFGDEPDAAEPEPDLDTAGLAKRVLDARRAREIALKRLDELHAKRWKDLEVYHQAIEQEKENLAAAAEDHPLAGEIAAWQRDLEETEATYTEACQELATGWDVEEKSIRFPEGLVSRRTTMGVRVTDTEAAARDLLERRLFAFVKKLDVDASKLRPLLDAGGIAGIEPLDKHSISVKLEARP